MSEQDKINNAKALKQKGGFNSHTSKKLNGNGDIGTLKTRNYRPERKPRALEPKSGDEAAYICGMRAAARKTELAMNVKGTKQATRAATKGPDGKPVYQPKNNGPWAMGVLQARQDHRDTVQAKHAKKTPVSRHKEKVG